MNPNMMDAVERTKIPSLGNQQHPTLGAYHSSGKQATNGMAMANVGMPSQHPQSLGGGFFNTSQIMTAQMMQQYHNTSMRNSQLTNTAMQPEQTSSGYNMNSQRQPHNQPFSAGSSKA